MTDKIRPARTETFEHTISGLLSMRAALFAEAVQIRDRLAEIRNDIDALDRTLGVLGYIGDLDSAMPRQRRHVVFGRGELSRAIYEELRIAKEPLSSRDIARAIMSAQGQDARDRRYIADLTRRVSKALRSMKAEGRVQALVDAKQNILWKFRDDNFLT